MDTAVDVLATIYGVCKAIHDGQDAVAQVYTQLSDLLQQLQAMSAADTLVQSNLLEKYVDIAIRFLECFEIYRRRSFLSKVLRQKWVLEHVDSFKAELDTLFRVYHLAMGSHMVEAEREQTAQLDELTRGVRVLLEGAEGGGRRRRRSKWTTDRAERAAKERDAATTTEDAAAVLVPVSPASLAVIKSVEGGGVETAAAKFDWAMLVSFVRSGGDSQKQQAAAALFELSINAEHLEEIVKAGATHRSSTCSKLATKQRK